jgi:hypothetical protein
MLTAARDMLPDGFTDICDANLKDIWEAMHQAMLASAPAPASGGVDAVTVAVKPLEWVEEQRRGAFVKYIARTPFGGYEVNSEFTALTASGPMVCLPDWKGPLDSSNRRAVSVEEAKAAAQADYEQRIRSALSPAATPVSEAGGGPTYVVNCCNCGRIVDTREAAEGGDDFGSELADGERWVCSPECWDSVVEPTLAKPASSPAGELLEALSAEKPFIFDPGTCFAHADDGGAPAHGVRWAPQEEASPAGGDVVREALRELYEWYDRDGSVGGASEVFEKHRAALSQSTSAGRVGE